MNDADDAIQRFLAEKTFYCPHLRAKISKDECVARQDREVQWKLFGRKIALNNTIQDRWCRSKLCELGNCVRRYMRSKSLKPCDAKVRKAQLETARKTA